jgi:hypothetical protein
MFIFNAAGSLKDDQRLRVRCFGSFVEAPTCRRTQNLAEKLLDPPILSAKLVKSQVNFTNLSAIKGRTEE